MNVRCIINKLNKLDLNNNSVPEWRNEIIQRELNEKNGIKQESSPYRRNSRRRSLGPAWRDEILDKETIGSRADESFGALNRSSSNSSFSNERKSTWANPGWNKSIVFNDKFDLVFDIPTPRPHFIIKLKQSDKTKSSLADLSGEEIKQILKLIENFCDDFNITEKVVLSFHTGHWLSESKFHCHLCVALPDYLRVFNQINPRLENFTPTSNWVAKSPDSNYKTMKEVYIKNVLDFKKQAIETSFKYKQRELELIQIKKSSSRSNSSSSISVNNDYELSFDFSEPKLKFSNKRQKEIAHLNRLDSNEKLLHEMCQFALNQGLFRKDNGCHICVNLNTSEISSGYLHVSADSYFCMHPFPEIFLKNFQNLDEYIIQT